MILTKNKLLLTITVFLCMFSFSLVAQAGGFSISANPTNVTVGNTVKLTLNVSDQAGRFLISSSDNSVLSGGIDEFYDSTSTTIYFTAKKAGSATITVKAVDVTNYDGSSGNGSKSITIKVSNPSSGGSSGNRGSNSSSGGSKKPSSGGSNSIDINKTYSSDNYLSDLKVEGYNIDFSKEKLEYELDVDEDVNSINITATSNDDNANVIGTGNIKLTDGVNNIKITVVAENGNEKVYQIIVNVKDLNPIKVKVGKEEYTVVKKVEQLTAPDNFSPIEADIDGKKVPALYNDITGYILVGLKDKDGNVKLYVYDSKTDSYSIYNELTFNSVKLFYTDPKNVPKGFEKVKIDLNGEKVIAYTVDKKSDFYLVYGMNVNTGEIGWYRYDSVEKTLQRYETKDLEALSIINNKYLITIVILSVSILMLMLFILVLITKIREKR